MCTNVKRIRQLLTAQRFARQGRRGFTLLELLMVAGILGTLATLTFPNFMKVMADSKVLEAISEIRVLAATARDHKLVNGVLPDDFSKMGLTDPLDPWGNKYEYLLIEGQMNVYSPGKKPRQDMFLRPINRDFDIYSRGPDGESAENLTMPDSLDDIIRANDGLFVGSVSDF